MDKDIIYSGHDVASSDYAATDGQLQLSLNLINENGHLTPIMPPSLVANMPVGLQVIATHRLAEGITHLIAIRRTPAALMCIPLEPASDIANPEKWVEMTTDIPDTDSVPIIVPIGNTITVTFPGQEKRYLLYREGKYVNLGARPPFTTIEFALKFKGTLGPDISTYKVKVPIRFSTGRAVARPDDPEETQRRRELQAELDNIYFSYLNEHVADKVTRQGCFHQPFFVRYAYRLYDGTYAWHSSPVLMLPTTIVPPIIYSGYDDSDTNIYQTLTLYGSKINIFSLYHRIIAADFERLSLWKDIVTHIDIFITPPVYTYKFESDANTSWYDSGANVCRHTDRLSLYNFALDCTEKPVASEGFIPGFNKTGGTSGDRDHRNPSRADGDKSYFFDGHYIKYEYKLGDERRDDRAIDQIISISGQDPKSNPRLIAGPYNPDFADDIRNAAKGNFYLYASIAVDDIAASDKASYLIPETQNLENLVTRQSLPDDYMSHAGIAPKTALAYNQRLNIANLTITPASLPLRSAIAMSTPGDNPEAAFTKSITVWLRKNGVVIRHTTDTSSSVADALYGISDSGLEELPRYIFYPDPDAFAISIRINDATTINIPLTPHKLLHGAYFFGGFAEKISIPKTDLPDESGNFASSYSMVDRIWLSEVNNPFIFPPAYAVSVGSAVGNSAIKAIATAARPLSQGQFGQFPLYAFTDEGIWAIELSAQGTYIARQPITRDICKNTDSITPIDSAILFTSERGIMLISGSQTQCISDRINSSETFSLETYPAIPSLGLNAPDIIPLLEYIRQARIIYDYTNQRIYVYSPQHDYAYVYSLRTQLWGMSSSDIVSHLNAYPRTLAITSGNHLVDLSHSDMDASNFILVTRPINLDMPDMLKTITTLIQRGRFHRGHVKSMLYGSRNLFDWHPVLSSQDHYMRGFRGTPYKHYRIVSIGTLDQSESVSAASVRFTPRQTDQPR